MFLSKITVSAFVSSSLFSAASFLSFYRDLSATLSSFVFICSSSLNVPAPFSCKFVCHTPSIDEVEALPPLRSAPAPSEHKMEDEKEEAKSSKELGMTEQLI
ncbi:hypothetical protein LXL04_016206 [Taraxacum kok-saghyz]